jgi:hypothetical protein
VHTRSAWCHRCTRRTHAKTARDTPHAHACEAAAHTHAMSCCMHSSTATKSGWPPINGQASSTLKKAHYTLPMHTQTCPSLYRHHKLPVFDTPHQKAIKTQADSPSPRTAAPSGRPTPNQEAAEGLTADHARLRVLGSGCCLCCWLTPHKGADQSSLTRCCQLCCCCCWPAGPSLRNAAPTGMLTSSPEASGLCQCPGATAAASAAADWLSASSCSPATPSSRPACSLLLHATSRLHGALGTRLPCCFCCCWLALVPQLQPCQTLPQARLQPAAACHQQATWGTTDQAPLLLLLLAGPRPPAAALQRPRSGLPVVCCLHVTNRLHGALLARLPCCCCCCCCCLALVPQLQPCHALA